MRQVACKLGAWWQMIKGLHHTGLADSGVEGVRGGSRDSGETVVGSDISSLIEKMVFVTSFETYRHRELTLRSRSGRVRVV